MRSPYYLQDVATGNWIKIVQRVPVEVSLDPKELMLHSLRIGLSDDSNY